MAGFIDNLKIFENYVLSAMTEVEQDYSETFNAASGGAVTLGTRQSMGNFKIQNFWKKKDGLVTIEDIKTNASVSSIMLEQDDYAEPKFKYRVGPVAWDPSSSMWQGMAANSAGTALGQQLGIVTPLTKLNAALGATVACLDRAASRQDSSGGTTADPTRVLKYPAIIDAQAKLGAAYGRIRSIIMHSKSWFDLTKDNLSSYQEILTGLPSIRLFTDPISGARIIVLDNEELKYTQTIQKYYVLLLTDRAVNLYDSGDYLPVTETKTGNNNIQTVFQAQGSTQLGVKGFGFSTAAADTSPTLAELKTAAKWTWKMSSIKDGPGILLKVQ